jgi:hypothetical protein
MLQASRKRVVVEAPNDLWTVDFKGWWTTRDGRRCEPLTVRDAFSRYILALRILPRSDTDGVRAVFEELFERHGLPKVIQSDNGAPFAAGRSLAGLTKLSAWWVSLGIDIVRSRPGCPQDNGAHERMHADISIELETPSAQSIRAQQRACDDWRTEFNHIRPHEALGMETPADVYRSSPRRLLRARVGGFPDDVEIMKLGAFGKCWFDGRHHVFVSSSLGGMQVGFQRLTDGLVHVWFFHLLIGQFRIGAGIGRNVQVQPMPPSETNARRGDTEGDMQGDTVPQAPDEVSPISASARTGGPAEIASAGNTGSGTLTGQLLPSGKEASENNQKQVA